MGGSDPRWVGPKAPPPANHSGQVQRNRDHRADSACEFKQACGPRTGVRRRGTSRPRPISQPRQPPAASSGRHPHWRKRTTGEARHRCARPHGSRPGAGPRPGGARWSRRARRRQSARRRPTDPATCRCNCRRRAAAWPGGYGGPPVGTPVQLCHPVAQDTHQRGLQAADLRHGVPAHFLRGAELDFAHFRSPAERSAVCPEDVFSRDELECAVDRKLGRAQWSAGDPPFLPE